MELYHAKLVRNDKPVATVLYSAYFDDLKEADAALSDEVISKNLDLQYDFGLASWRGKIDGIVYFGFVVELPLIDF